MDGHQYRRGEAAGAGHLERHGVVAGEPAQPLGHGDRQALHRVGDPGVRLAVARALELVGQQGIAGGQHAARLDAVSVPHEAREGGSLRPQRLGHIAKALNGF
ncbi:hypothetical protein CKO44_00335 [Rubrivivax gelatinosus]|uniref:Uncharacterized protein n=1 Tax=Rubrivivax gelatinosus TaxID=28068 RepID=A0ABS1DQA5_RUBGE|nr:hypothetical protein [Rubrivivax gelatinosus]MBK1711574.1 hypothetical protein [Rubrivivax gelatinosus]